MRSAYVLTFDLDDPSRAEVFATTILRLKQGAPPAEVLESDDAGAVTIDRIEFHGIAGGRERAGEIARTISRQKEHLTGPEPPATPESGESDDEIEVELRVFLGRGVSSWVNGHGGTLYVWGEPFSDAFETMKASTEPPAGVGFVRSSEVGEFELHIEAGLRNAKGIRLARRWFGLRSGISVDTGLLMGGGV